MLSETLTKVFTGWCIQLDNEGLLLSGVRASLLVTE